jgi:hypothetical protein
VADAAVREALGRANGALQREARELREASAVKRVVGGPLGVTVAEQQAQHEATSTIFVEPTKHLIDLSL